jgi:creatinine amidohydrolase/Fe(II)-dependent formamide hydrolase-like protein
LLVKRLLTILALLLAARSTDGSVVRVTDLTTAQIRALDRSKTVVFLPALVFPQIPFGASGYNEIGGHYMFPGTYAVRPSTLRLHGLASEIGEQGFKWIVVVHVHGSPVPWRPAARMAAKTITRGHVANDDCPVRS